MGHSYILLKTSHCSWSLDGGPSIWKYLLYLHLINLCLQYFTVVTVWFRECSYSADVYRVFLAFTAVFCSWISGVSEHLLLGWISGALFSTCSFSDFRCFALPHAAPAPGPDFRCFLQHLLQWRISGAFWHLLQRRISGALRYLLQWWISGALRHLLQWWISGALQHLLLEWISGA